jgi:hypothetical protein
MGFNDPNLVESGQATPLGALSRFIRQRPPAERCELCSAGLGAQHAHLVEPATRKLLCSCDACALLFTDRPDARFVRVPRDARFLEDFILTDDQWEALHLPINLAFLFQSTSAQRVVALYPSPAGAVESLLPLEAWAELVFANPALTTMRPDVEALLVNRLGTARDFDGPECYIAPIDQCYQLVGLVRAHWHGLSGGTDVWREIRAFFDRLRANATVVRQSQEAHA